MNIYPNLQSRRSNPRILLDVSYTISSSRNSGIERVVNNIRHHWIDLAKKSCQELTSVISYGGKFYEISPALDAKFTRQASLNRNVLATLPQLYRSTANLVCKIIPFDFFRRWLLPEPGHLGIFKPFAEISERNIRRGIQYLRPVDDLSENDLVVMPDAYWTEMQALDAARDARNRGATVVTLIYDLIPLTNPETVGSQRSRDFLEYFREASFSADALIAISKTVRDEVREAIPRLFSHKIRSDELLPCHDIRHFRLGADLPSIVREGLSIGESSENSTLVSPDIQTVFGTNPQNRPYLMVSMFDPRKNHRYVLDVFDTLWKTNPNIRLCLVGRKGRLCTEVLNRIAQHPQLNKSLFVFHQATDLDLVYCYQHAAAALMPSIAEGFGLPIVESLHMGCDTMASDIPVHREVGHSLCEYFDISDPNSLAMMILNHQKKTSLQKNHVNSASSKSYQVTTWQESATELFELSLQIYQEKQILKRPISKAA